MVEMFAENNSRATTVARAVGNQRLVESVESAAREGLGEATLWRLTAQGMVSRPIRSILECCGQRFPEAREGMFSFASPLDDSFFTATASSPRAGPRTESTSGAAPKRTGSIASRSPLKAP